MAKEKNLTSITTVAAADFARIVTSAGASVKATAANLAKYIVETYNGSTVAGSAQSVKSALDSLNSNITGTSWTVMTDTPVSYCKRGNIVFVKISSASVGTTWTTLATLPTGYRPNASITTSGSAGSYGKLHIGVLVSTGGAVQVACAESRTDGHALVAFPV